MTAIDDLLACPRCDRSPLETAEASLRCTACKVDFPLIDGIPWLFAEPKAALGEWRSRLGFALSRLERNDKELEAALKGPALRELTRERLTRMREAVETHAGQLKHLMTPLLEADSGLDHATFLALRTRLPPDQGINTYAGNVHRDWGWGHAENAASFAIVRERLGDTPPGKVLVLGAGAGRLAYDLHMQTSPEVTVALDFNPLLLLIAQRVTRGETVELLEFPLAPANADEQAVMRELRAEEPVREGFHYVLGDAHRPPFVKGGFDTVVTPWLIDILPEPFEVLCARVNHLLADDGRWINFGSLNFHAANPALRYGPEECAAIVAESGFTPPETREDEIPYMCSPSSRHGRREKVLSWAATRSKKAGKVPRHEALPDWLVRGQDPVPSTRAFQTQAASTRIHAFIMSLIDGRRSLKDIAEVCVEQKLMATHEAEATIRAFLIRMYDDSRRGSSY